MSVCTNPGLCANGDGNPICPPSKVICRKCLDKITATLHGMLERAQKRELDDRKEPSKP